MKTIVSKFMSDHSTGAHGLESILDYELSWVLRMAADKDCCEKMPRLFYQCRQILFKLLNIKKFSNITVAHVRVWKQWKRVDLLAEISLVKEGKSELHILMVEDKAYTMLTPKQRDEYPQLVKEKFVNVNAKYTLHQSIITCYDKKDQKYKELSDFIKRGTEKWKLFSIYTLPDKEVKELTESDLFNEFWLNDWIQYID